MNGWLRNLFGGFQKNSRFEGWTRSQLITKIKTLENQLKRHEPIVKAGRRPFQINEYGQRKIALRVAYLGWPYSGFATQGDEIAVPTVEGQLFKALESCRFIADRQDCEFSRCGRTDKGVSGLGQVVALNVRASQTKGNSIQDLNYIETLNRLLPQDIRVLAWAPVADDFNARFDCKSRTYRYFFEKGQLDLDLMRKAASYMIGSHDFRNFCKLDPSKNITNYHRKMVSLDIKPINEQFYYVELKGTAFLWHQVRCMMSILFLIGQKLEAPEVVQDLLNIDTVNARPDYPMANELPLMLYDCEFDNLKWRYSREPIRIQEHFHELWSSQFIKSLLYQQVLKAQANNEKIDKSIILLGSGRQLKTKNYKKLLERPRADSDQVKKEKYRLKKLNK